MRSLLLRRLGGALVVLLLVSTLVFALVHLAPGDAAELVAGDRATETQVAHIREELGLNRPLVSQFGEWFSGLVRFDLGDSLVSGRSVGESLSAAAPPTVSITLVAIAISMAAGVSVGVVAGLRTNSWIDRVLTLMTSVALATPSFWVGLVLVSVLALSWDWFPATGYQPLSAGLGTWFSHVILPAVALSTSTVAEIARQTRGGVVDVMSRPYVRTARARGSGGLALIRRHVLRNAAIPIVTVLGLQAGRLLGGVVVIEAVFGISGLGTLGVTAVQRRDLPVLQGYVLLVAAVVVTMSLLVDMAYVWINPKTRLEGR